MRIACVASIVVLGCEAATPTPPSPDAKVASQCGDGVAEAAEVCDGADVRGATCGPLEVGVMRCAPGCDGYDVSACHPLEVDGGAPDSGAPDAGDAGVFEAGTFDAGRTFTMALGVSGSRFVLGDGGAIDVRGAISCCGGGYGWPLVDEAWIRLTSSNDVNFLHLRLGPYLTSTANGETELASYGGGYLEDGGVADLDHFNPRFWARVRELISLARAQHMWVEIDLVDGWAIKHCRWGDLPGYSAWARDGNAQGVDLCATAGSGSFSAGSIVDRWVRQVVRETGAFDNVVYQDGNEISLVASYSPAWTIGLRDAVRSEESRLGLTRHLFGTNADEAAAIGAVDFVELHQDQPATVAQCRGKPCLVNEYNPRPPLTAAQFHQRFCAAKNQGTSFWYWRHEQSDPVMQQSLASLGQPCP